MPCYSPLEGWRSRAVNPSGKRSIVFNRKAGYVDMPVTVPCGRCIGCRLDYSRMWAIRCVHEASQHAENSFVTLTYNNDHLPENMSVNKEELQKFFKRLRKELDGKFIRYFACGEYGEKLQRPHYHAIIFGHSFMDDRILHAKRNGHLLYRSPTLEKVWKFGFSLIGEVTFQSAAYVARYVVKKRKGDDNYVDPKTGKSNKEYYMIVDKETGEVHFREPEFCIMSRGSKKRKTGGLGRGWLEKYKSDTDKDFITMVDGSKHPLPKYYDDILAMEDELAMLERKRKRRKAMEENPEEQYRYRLQQKEAVKEVQAEMLERTLNEDT